MFRVPPSLHAFLRLPGMPSLAAPVIVALAAGLSACANGNPTQAGTSASPEGHWQVLSIDGRAAVGQTMQIDADGQVSGHAGCNRYVSSVQRSGPGQLGFAPAAATKMACMEEGKMQSESSFLRMLDAVRAFRVTGNGMVLLDEAGQVLAELSAID